MPEVAQIISDAVKHSVQSEPSQPVERGMGGIAGVLWMAQAGLYMPPWWSPARDIALRNFWKKNDHLGGAIYTLEAKMTSIPFRILPRDPSIRAHVLQGQQMTEDLYASAGFGDGWMAFFETWLEDYLSQDNGMFAEIIGPGSKDGPIIGKPISIAALDASRCTRTGNAEFPVIYQDIQGPRYKMHYSRVMFPSQMSSPIADMYGVGLCGVSRCVNVAQTLLDILTFKQEKLGSRPHRSIIIPKGGLDPNDIQSAFQLAESSMDSSGLSRYSKIVVAGSSSLPEASLETHALSELPDGFDEETSIILGMATIALAFGVDARELFPAISSGATRADALLQHLKQRGKGPGQIIQTVEHQFNHKYLPQHLKMEFDYQDDAQDRQVAEIKKIRADRRVQDLSSGSLNLRITREQMVDQGDLTRSQFERLELLDGRLADGASVLALFYSEKPVYKEFLDMGVSDPLDVEANNSEAILTIIGERVADTNRKLIDDKNEERKRITFEAMIALLYLKQHYENPESSFEELIGISFPVDEMKNDPRVRTIDNTSPNSEEEAKVEGKKPVTQDHLDDKVK